jgi:hypothetical protein
MDVDPRLRRGRFVAHFIIFRGFIFSPKVCLKTIILAAAKAKLFVCLIPKIKVRFRIIDFINFSNVFAS